MRPHISLRIWLVPVLLILLAIALLPAVVSAAPEQQTGGYYYTVQTGDTWSKVSAKVGVTVAQLKAANPRLRRANDWLYRGDRLFVPRRAPAATAVRPAATPVPPAVGGTTGTGGAGYMRTVGAGETWYSISLETGVSIRDLWNANPKNIHARYWLYAGEQLLIPGKQAPVVAKPPLPTPAPTAMPLPSPTPTAIPPIPTVVPQAQATTPPATVVVSVPLVAGTDGSARATQAAPAVGPQLPAATPDAAPTGTPAPAPTVVPGCPAQFSAYPDFIASYLAQRGANTAGLEGLLTNCNAVKEDLGSVTEVDIQGNKSRDLVVVIHDPLSVDIVPPGTILVYHAAAAGYGLAGRADGTGKVDVLKVADTNQDKAVDIVWTDTTCGAHTCFSTLFVDSWDGTSYRDWIDGEPTMAYPDFKFETGQEGGQGEAILMHGGVIGSVGAGPQRGWTEIYVSPVGDPYRLGGQLYDDSDCLYHHILDANKAFDDWVTGGFDPAIQAYRAALDDQSLVTCGGIDDELQQLRDFANFRLMVANAAGGRPAEATPLLSRVQGAALQGVAKSFMDSFQQSGSIVQACRDVTAYAEKNPGSWEFMAEWGYANPGFAAEDLCPLAR